MAKENTYFEKLKDPRWQRRRLQVFERDNWSCQYCSDSNSTLNVHHKIYTGEPWDCPLEQLITLCEDCHTIISFEKIDINKQVVVIRKIHRDSHIAFLLITGTGVTFYIKEQDKPIQGLVTISHEVLHFVIDDVINYWQKAGLEHLITKKFEAIHG